MNYNYQDAKTESQQEYFGTIHTDNTKTLQNALDRIEELESENGKLKSLIEEKHKVGNCEFWKRVWYSIWKNEELEQQIEKMKCDVNTNIKVAQQNNDWLMESKLASMILQWEGKRK